MNTIRLEVDRVYFGTPTCAHPDHPQRCVNRSAQSVWLQDPSGEVRRSAIRWWEVTKPAYGGGDPVSYTVEVTAHGCWHFAADKTSGGDWAPEEV